MLKLKKKEKTIFFGDLPSSQVRGDEEAHDVLPNNTHLHPNEPIKIQNEEDEESEEFVRDIIIKKAKKEENNIENTDNNNNLNNKEPIDTNKISKAVKALVENNKNVIKNGTSPMELMQKRKPQTEQEINIHSIVIRLRSNAPQ